MHISHPKARRRHQQGATLVMALIILVLIMMLGIVAVGSSSTQFKLAGNLQFDNNAMNSAERAVSTAENWLSTGTNFRDPGFTTYSSTVTPGLYPTTSTAAVVVSPLTTTFSSTNATCVDSNTSCASSYVVQLMSVNNTLIGSSQAVGGRKTTSCNKVNTYQITGRGMGGRGASKTLASYYSVLSCNGI
jgi:Tfp pilus assembly protein PilX